MGCPPSLGNELGNLTVDMGTLRSLVKKPRNIRSALAVDGPRKAMSATQPKPSPLPEPFPGPGPAPDPIPEPKPAPQPNPTPGPKPI